MPNEGALDTIARGLAGGMSRRDALRTGGAALAATFVLSPSSALARVTKRCPHHRVKCNGKCCPPGEVCLHPKRKRHQRRKPKPHCGCAPGTVRCKGKCVHLKTDAHNCGRCGHKCGRGQQCLRGRCVTACPAGQMFCGGACINVQTDPKNCGGCGQKCRPGGVCHKGACLNVCPSGYTECNGGCVNLSSDAANCGACGAVCARGTVCSHGTCSSGGCPSGTVNCNGSCVNIGSDPHHCGACGNVCAGTQACVSYSCSSTCPSGQTKCGQYCVNLKSDGGNCGACGHSCPGTQVCSGGTCVSGGCPSGTATCSSSCCAGTGCCAGVCQTQHNNGIGAYYYDCGTLASPGVASTYSLQLAKEAAAAYAPGASTITRFCPGGDVLYTGSAGGYAGWGYSGSIAGYVTLEPGAPVCPSASATSLTWN